MRYIQDPKTLKLVPADEYYALKSKTADNSSFYIVDDIKPFVSPVDMSVISSRSGLRKHNTKHGVTDIREYGSDWFKRKGNEHNDTIHGNTPEARKERVNALIEACKMYD